MFDSEETKGFMYGFLATVAAGLATLYIFQKYIAEKAATSAIQSYRQQFEVMSPIQSQFLQESVASPAVAVAPVASAVKPMNSTKPVKTAKTDKALLQSFGMI